MKPKGENRKGLDGKVAIITGATGGIGEATARLFLHEGARVMLVGRSAEKLQQTRDRLGVETGVAHLVADAVDEEATAAAVASAVELFGGVDILVANAGTEGKFNPIEALSRKDFEQVLQTNVIGVWLSMKYCVEQGAGKVLPGSSGAATFLTKL